MSTETDTPAAAPAPAPVPAYGVIKARNGYIWAGRRLLPGEVVIDLRARGGKADLDAFRANLKWSAFTVEIVEGPAVAPAPAATPDTGELDTLRAELAQVRADAAAQIDQLRAEAVQLRDLMALPQTPLQAVSLIHHIAASQPADLIALPGIGEKKAADLIAAAIDLVAATPAAPTV